MENNQGQLLSPYKIGADDGFYFGLYLAVMFLAMFYSITIPIFSVIVVLMIVVTPIIVYFALRRTFLLDGKRTPMGSLWMQGIVMFFCGSLISGLVAFFMMRIVDPGWLHRVLEISVETIESLPGNAYDETYELLRNMLDHNILPTPIQMVFESVWSAVLIGSLVSLICSLLVIGVGNRKRSSWGEHP